MSFSWLGPLLDDELRRWCSFSRGLGTGLCKVSGWWRCAVSHRHALIREPPSPSSAPPSASTTSSWVALAANGNCLGSCISSVHECVCQMAAWAPCKGLFSTPKTTCVKQDTVNADTTYVQGRCMVSLATLLSQPCKRGVLVEAATGIKLVDGEMQPHAQHVRPTAKCISSPHEFAYA